MTLQTDHLTVRPFTLADAPFILEIVNEPSFIHNIRDSMVRSLADAERYITDGPMASYARHGFGLMRVALRQTDEPVGMCGLLKRDTLEHPDLGFAMLERFGGRGYATESAQGIMDHGREALGLKTIVGVTATDNAASGRVLEKVGMRFQGTIETADHGPARYYVWEAGAA